MKKYSQRKYLELVAVFDGVLTSEGFAPSDLKRFKRNEWKVWAWTKVVDEVLVHQVELLVNRHGMSDALANQAVYLIDGERDSRIDGQTLSGLYDKNMRIFLEDGIVASLLWGLKKKKIARVLRDSLAWFEPFSSISHSIERIESGQSNMGSGPAADKVVQLLRSYRTEGT